MSKFNNIPIKVFYKTWECVNGKSVPMNTTKDKASLAFYQNGYLKANIYKYTEDDGRLQLEDDYYDMNEIDISDKSRLKASHIENGDMAMAYASLDSLVTKLFRDYAHEEGIRLDIEVIC